MATEEWGAQPARGRTGGDLPRSRGALSLEPVRYSKFASFESKLCVVLLAQFACIKVVGIAPSSGVRQDPGVGVGIYSVLERLAVE